MKLIYANHSHIGRILEIENSSFSCPWSEKSFCDAVDSPNISICAAEDENDGICGFMCVLIIAGEAELLNIAVDEKHRGHGIGSYLMDHMIDLAGRNNVERIFLEVRESNTPARSLYEKYGFEIIGKRRRYYTKPVEDAVLMQKTIGIQ